jgi:hypothetical protein
VAAGAATPAAFAAAPAERTGWRADLAVIELYSVRYPALVRLAAMLVRDTTCPRLRSPPRCGSAGAA